MEKIHYRYDDWGIFSCLQKAYISSDFQKKTSFPSGSLCCSAAAVLLHICLESHDHEQKNSVSFISTAFEISSSPASQTIGLVNFLIIHPCIYSFD